MRAINYSQMPNKKPNYSQQQTFNDRAIPASQRYPDEPQTGQAENTGSVTIRRGSYLWLTTEKKLNALRERILGNRTNFDMARHVDDRFEMCQRDYGDEHEDGRRFTNRNA